MIPEQFSSHSRLNLQTFFWPWASLYGPLSLYSVGVSVMVGEGKDNHTQWDLLCVGNSNIHTSLGSWDFPFRHSTNPHVELLPDQQVLWGFVL